MLEEDIDDTHLCIKCSTTIVGLENYVQHRKNNCSSKTTTVISRDVVHGVDHRYRSFDFTESSSFHKPEEVEKSAKSLNDTYDLPYDLGADVFFSSLELQSSSRKALTNSAAISTGGKYGPSRVLTRKATAALLSNQEHNDGWISESHSSDNLMKAVRDISGNKKCDSVFKLLSFQHDSPDPSDDEDDDDEDYEVPSTHTGGKWKPDNPLPPSILRNSPAWDDRAQWDITEPNNVKPAVKTQDTEEFEHDLIPPPSHTKGKWVPGTKIVKLNYKEEDVEIEKIFSDQYWCNTCNRKLTTKLLYERHVRSNLHLKRSEPEQELEQASHPILLPKFSERVKKRSIYLNDILYQAENIKVEEKQSGKKVRKRRKYFIKCETCKMRLPKHLLGKHLISHYHYRRMSQNPVKSFDLVLSNIEKIVQQAPYQCHPCRFYTNTQQDFIDHWNSADHAYLVEGPGRFCCNFCKFECEDNNQMRRHLLGQDHREVDLAINRSFPIIIGKRTIIECPKCQQAFRYNLELRKHAKHCTFQPAGTASNDYQSKFVCDTCNLTCKSRLSLQKHEVNRHQKQRYFCSACKIDFNSSEDAKKHRTTPEHKIAAAKNTTNLAKKCKACGSILKDLLELKEHMIRLHPDVYFPCPHCGKRFILPQEVGRHIRDKLCLPYICKESHQPTAVSSEAVEFLGNTGLMVSDSAITPVKMEEPTKANEFRCTLCNYRTTLKAELLYHEILHSAENIDKDTKLPCSVCQKMFRKHSLRCHLRQHTNERLFECDQCPMKYSRKHNLKTHVDNAHSASVKEEGQLAKVTSFQCDACGKCFSKKHSLKQHVIVHSERDKKFKCRTDGCIFIGRNASDLKEHLSVHTSKRSFQCDYEGCDYKGKSMTLLKRHKKIHKPLDKKFTCSQCDFKARIPGHLKRHLRIHTGEKPYKCPYCDFQCNASENLRKHVLTTSLHAGRGLYECSFCDPNDVFKTNFQKEYRAHLVVSHRLDRQGLKL